MRAQPHEPRPLAWQHTFDLKCFSCLLVEIGHSTILYTYYFRSISPICAATLHIFLDAAYEAMLQKLVYAWQAGHNWLRTIKRPLPTLAAHNGCEIECEFFTLPAL